MLFEGFIIAELLKKGIRNIKFWQDKNGHEVDIIAEKDSRLVPIEAKQILKADDFIGMNSFAKEYKKIKKFYLINLAVQKKSGNTRLILPYSVDSSRSGINCIQLLGGLFLTAGAYLFSPSAAAQLSCEPCSTKNSCFHNFAVFN